MNIKLTIRLQNDQLQTDSDDKFVIMDKSKSACIQNMLISPIYALPSDISDNFMEEPGTYLNTLFKIIHEGSVKADQLLPASLVQAYSLTPEATFQIKRRYVICYSTFNFGKIFYRDYLKSVKKSKFLADVKVSLEIEKEPQLIQQLQGDAKACMQEIEDGLQAHVNMRGFVKGELLCSNKTAARQWYPSLGYNTPDVSMASGKSTIYGKSYKIDTQYGHGYWNW